MHLSVKTINRYVAKILTRLDKRGYAPLATDIKARDVSVYTSWQADPTRLYFRLNFEGMAYGHRSFFQALFGQGTETIEAVAGLKHSKLVTLVECFSLVHEEIPTVTWPRRRSA